MLSRRFVDKSSRGLQKLKLCRVIFTDHHFSLMLIYGMDLKEVKELSNRVESNTS